MTVINKKSLMRPVPRQEAVQVEGFEGEVIVRGLMLSERVRILTAAQVSGSLSISELLACAVVDVEGEPIFAVDEWEAFGANHFLSAVELFKKAKELSGLDAEVNQKK